MGLSLEEKDKKNPTNTHIWTSALQWNELKLFTKKALYSPKAYLIILNIPVEGSIPTVAFNFNTVSYIYFSLKLS